MADLKSIAGIVLAGGRSSRMGQNKALLDFKGKPLISHMMDLLRQTGFHDVFVSGSMEGYPCIEDHQTYAGPALAIKHVLRMKPAYRGYLFVPVDMPLLLPEALSLLLVQEEGAYFAGSSLPVFLTPPFVQDSETSVQNFLAVQGVYPLDLPPHFEPMMKNTNTPQEWQEVVNP